jgi:hypothetical protein
LGLHTLYIFVNEKEEQLSLEWFNECKNHYPKITGGSKDQEILLRWEKPEIDDMHGSQGGRRAPP